MPSLMNRLLSQMPRALTQEKPASNAQDSPTRGATLGSHLLALSLVNECVAVQQPFYDVTLRVEFLLASSQKCLV